MNTGGLELVPVQSSHRTAPILFFSFTASVGPRNKRLPEVHRRYLHVQVHILKLKIFNDQLPWKTNHPHKADIETLSTIQYLNTRIAEQQGRQGAGTTHSQGPSALEV